MDDLDRPARSNKSEDEPIAIPVDADDKQLIGLIGRSIRSASDEAVSFVVEEKISFGASATTFRCVRQGRRGNTPVVLKVLTPAFVRSTGKNAMLAAQKEVTALARLNAQVPCTPFVVRLVDAGWLSLAVRGVAISVPWLAVEYVHGGPMGTTLTQRVAHAMSVSGCALDPWRAARAIDCLARGIAAVHAVGVIHRDLKPENVLCCGLGADEMFKVADFGVARAEGAVATFGQGIVGTLGYAAPEQLLQESPVGPWTDVFALGAVTFFLLTGEVMFPARSLAQFLVQVQRPERRSILDSPGLSPALRDREVAARAIDVVLADATANNAQARPQTGPTFSAAIVTWLRSESWHKKTTFPLGDQMTLTPPRGWAWTTRHDPTDDYVVRGVAWDGDGSCLFVTTQGLAFWDGSEVRRAPTRGLPDPTAIRFIRRLGPGRWLIVCEDSLFAIYTTEGVSETSQFSDGTVALDDFVGDLRDLGVGLGRSPEGPELITLCGGRWFRAIALPGAASIMAMARVGDAEWLVAGRRTGGGAYAARYFALALQVEELAPPPVRALIAAGGDPERGVGVVAGAEGALLWFQEGRMTPEALPAEFDVSAVVVDAAGGAWVAGLGHIAYRDPAGERGWQELWSDEHARAPVVSLHADVGHLVAMTADGQILEGAWSEPRK